jgi:hypothetical protein
VAAADFWGEGLTGTRMHAMFSRDVPGGAAMYQAVSGELRITPSTPEWVIAMGRPFPRNPRWPK